MPPRPRKRGPRSEGSSALIPEHRDEPNSSLSNYLSIMLATVFAVVAMNQLMTGTTEVALLSEDMRKLPFDYPLFDFGAASTVSLPSGDSLRVAKASRTWNLGNFTKNVTLLNIESLMQPDEVAKMLGELPDSFSTAPDSVDNMPSYEYYLHYHGGTPKTGSVSSNLQAISSAVVEKRVLPFVRQQYNCTTCRICTSLVRRYRSNERTRHPPHFDTEAFVTIVVHLTTHGKHFRGGLYVRTSPGTEEFLQAVAGDAVAHQHDIEHGVWVREGSRVSWILWLEDSSSCGGPVRSWHSDAASRGDPISQYHMSSLYERGRGGVDKNEQEAVALLQSASLQGYPRAQHKLGNMLFSGIGVEENESAALEWYTTAAEQNFTFAAYATARMLEHGFGAAKDEASAISWYEKAASDTFEHFPDASDRLANMLFKGVAGVPKNEQAALSFWRQAASQGLSRAALSLARCYENGVAVEANAIEAQKWHARALEIKQG